jgi:hypothetical protein
MLPDLTRASLQIPARLLIRQLQETDMRNKLTIRSVDWASNAEVLDSPLGIKED